MIIISYVQTFLGDIKQTPNDRVLCWLGLNYVSANHTAARDKYEPKTGSWFLTSDTFIEWSNALNSSLWLHGKPGFGKTILSSSIIEHVIGLCKARPPDQCAYFYFDFNREWNATDMLRSIVAQLCTRKTRIPPEVHNLYRECISHHLKPDINKLREIFVSFLSSSHRTFIVLDALDECPKTERKRLLETIKTIIDVSPLYLNILVTSREEEDIEDKFEDLAINSVAIQSSDVQVDILRHVHKRLSKDKEFKAWGPDIKENVEKVLIKKSQGMYDAQACCANDHQVQDGRMPTETS